MQWKCRVDFDVFMGMHASAIRIICSFFYAKKKKCMNVERNSIKRKSIPPEVSPLFSFVFFFFLFFSLLPFSSVPPLTPMIPCLSPKMICALFFLISFFFLFGLLLFFIFIFWNQGGIEKLPIFDSFSLLLYFLFLIINTKDEYIQERDWSHFLTVINY